MKKLTILSGPSGSGKSHICHSIEIQHQEEMVWKFQSRTYLESKLSLIPINATLIVIVEVTKKRIAGTFELLEQKFPNAKFVMMTQDDIAAKDYDYAHVINCRNVVM